MATPAENARRLLRALTSGGPAGARVRPARIHVVAIEIGIDDVVQDAAISLAFQQGWFVEDDKDPTWIIITPAGAAV